MKHVVDAYEKMRARGWDTIYYLLDLHGTVYHNSYDGHDYKVYDRAIPCLKRLCALPETQLILWSSVGPLDKETYIDDLVNRGIPMKSIIGFNTNPRESAGTKVADFSEKPYFSVGIDDKFGFDPDTDWDILVDTAEKLSKQGF